LLDLVGCLHRSKEQQFIPKGLRITVGKIQLQSNVGLFVRTVQWQTDTSWSTGRKRIYSSIPFPDWIYGRPVPYSVIIPEVRWPGTWSYV